jgi:hypothetical protein
VTLGEATCGDFAGGACADNDCVVLVRSGEDNA